jgi:HlyD family secretion protein
MKKLVSYAIPILLLLSTTVGCGKETNTNKYSGIMEGNEVPVLSEVGGSINELKVDNGQKVKKGQVLAIVDQRTLKAQVEEAKAGVDMAMSKLAEAKAGTRDQEIVKSISAVEQSQSQTEQLMTQLAKAGDGILLKENQLTQIEKQWQTSQTTLAYQRKKLKELQALAEQGATPQDQVDAQREIVNQAQSAVDNLSEQVQANQTQLAMSQKDKETLQEQLKAAEAGERASGAQADLLKEGATSYTIAQLFAQERLAAAKLTEAQIQLSKSIIQSPMDGEVVEKDASVGEVLRPSSQLLTLMEDNYLEVKVYVPEAMIGQITLGQSAQIFVDSFPGKAFKGKVKEIAKKAEFTPKNVETADERTKMVFAVTVEALEGWNQLKAGMPADIAFVGGGGK